MSAHYLCSPIIIWDWVRVKHFLFVNNVRFYDWLTCILAALVLLLYIDQTR